MDANATKILNGVSPIIGSIIVIAIAVQVIKRVWHGQDGKRVSIDMLWFIPCVALGYNLTLLARLGYWGLNVLNNLITMMGFPPLQ
jgi:flagellin-like protein